MVTEPVAPETPTAISRSKSHITLQWMPPVTNGLCVEEYDIQMRQCSIDMNDLVTKLSDVRKWRSLFRKPHFCAAELEAGGGEFQDWKIKTREDGVKQALQRCKSEGLRAGIRYQFRVRCCNGHGWSPYSALGSAVLTTPDCPDRCTAPQFLKTMSRSITMEWDAPITNGEILDTYHVQRQELFLEEGKYDGNCDSVDLKFSAIHSDEWKDVSTPKDFVPVEDDLPPPTKFKCKNIRPATFHIFRVRALGHGWGDWSKCSRVVRTLADVPSTPGKPAMDGKTDQVIHVKWSHAFCQFRDSGIGNGLPIDGYELQHREKSESAPWKVVSKRIILELEFTVTDLKPVVRHWFRVRALNAIGWSAWSEASDMCRTDRRY